MTYRPYILIVNEAIASSSDAQVQLLNSTGGILAAWIPVCLDVNGNIRTIDVSVEFDSLNVVGILKNQTLNNTLGDVLRLGRIQNVDTLGFGFRDVIYVSKTGALTNIAPVVGVNGFVSGDFVVRVGHITKNQTNSANKDFLVAISIIGQL